MFRSYFKTTLRTIRRSPLTSFINIFGLAIAIGCSIMVYAFVSYDLATDQFHENRDRIFLATAKIDRNGEVAAYGITPRAYGEYLKQDFPQIRRVVRLENRSGVVKNGANVFNETISFTDPGFFDMFTFPLKWGVKEALADPGKIILSEALSIKYFGEKSPLGEVMTLDFGEGRRHSYEVGGVAAKFPAKSDFRFHMLIHFDNLESVFTGFDRTDWSRFFDATFVELNDPGDASTILENTASYVALQNEVQKDWPVRSFGFEPWTTLHENGESIRNTITGSADPLGRLVLTIIGIFMLTLACFNYINIAIVSATKRLKEIGVRKVMGGNRESLILQFLAENVLLTLFALIVGFVLAVTFFVPSFDRLFTIGLEFEYGDPNLWIFLTILVLFTGVASGAYPAFYISGFNAINIFRGRLTFGGKNKVTKAFLTFQFILSCITVVAGVMFTQNAHYQKSRDWGYNQSQVITASLSDSESLERLKHVMAQHPNVLGVSGSKHHIGRRWESEIIETPERKIEVKSMEIDPYYMNVMGIRLKEGRGFEANRPAEFRNALINEAMAKVLNTNAVPGQTFKMDSVRYTIIGIVEDYHHWSFYAPIEPTLFRLVEDSGQQFLSLSVRKETMSSTYEQLKEEWAVLFPEVPFNGFFQSQVFDWFFRQTTGHGKIMTSVAVLAIILSCLGLYGLVSLNLASRTKEFSIRKVLGARFQNIIRVIYKQFILFMIIAMVLGVPISYFLMDILFEAVYAYYKPITPFPFVLTVAIIIFMVLVTLSSQVRKVITANPTEGLRSE